MIDPSTSSTIECTIDCGWTTHVDPSGATSNSQRASITSSPLFISVAESIVIFGPIRHVGWRSASSGVTRRKLARGESAERSARGGQDQPAHVGRLASVQALMDRVVLAVDRQDRDAAAPAPPPSRCAPAMTRISLLASAIVLPASIAASTASSAAVPGRGEEHDVGVGMRGDRNQSLRSDSTRRRHRAAPTEFGARIGNARAVDIAIVSRLEPVDLLDEPRDVLAGRQRDDAQPSGCASHDRQRALADRAGRAEDGDLPHSSVAFSR